MNYRMLGYLLSIILLIEAALLLVPTLVALIYGESVMPFLITIALLVIVSAPSAIFRPKNRRIFAKEGFVCVAAAWVLMSLFGALPFVLDGAIPNFIDAFFETVSGFTTTGASILPAVEGLPKGILFWRSFTHWVGGMGVLVFMMAILPSAGGQAMYLMRAEVPGPTKGKLVPKMRQSSLILYGIYLALTVLMVIALLLCRMPLYDSLVNALATAGTGGFSVLNSSIAGYNNPAAEWVIAIFMVLFGINFNLYFFLLLRRFRDVFSNEELRTYLCLLAVSVTAIAINTAHLFEKAGDGIRTAFFQVATIISTAGFATTDFDLWPSFSKTVLLLLMVVGSCAGSTAGGLKLSRVIILLKSVARSVRQMLRPRSVTVVRVDGEAVEDRTVHTSLAYLAIWLLLVILSVLLISIDGFSLETNLSATLACINNIGPGFAAVGPTSNFAAFSYFSKILLSFVMLFGRLEIMPMLILFSPHTWSRK